MAPLTQLAALLGFSTIVLAQTPAQIVWASVAFTLYGEKVPVLTAGSYKLSPLGANQMFNAGTFFRNRNIAPPANTTQLTAPIQGIQTQELDNSQLVVVSTDDEYVSASAMAFMQGLYPPRGQPILDEEDLLSNGTYDFFPLDNYQYPNIGTVSALDFNYIWLAGNIGCPTWAIAQEEEIASTSYAAQINATQPFYASLASTIFSDYNPDIVNYENAWLLYEYASYQYNHKNQNHTISHDDLAQLYSLASQQQFAFNSPNEFGTIPSVAGSTLVAAILAQLNQNIQTSGVEDKLTLLFGSFEPFMAFFALSGLSTGQSAELFNSLPLPGSIMAFELFSNVDTSSGNSNQSFPTQDELYVRFLFRNGTNDTTQMIQYSLFNNPNSEDNMRWSDFALNMGRISTPEVNNWCATCEANALFCVALNSESGGNGTSPGASVCKSKKELSPAVGGIIGAAIMIALVLLGALTAHQCGIRLALARHQNREREGNAAVGGLGVLKRNGSGNGGFKGAEKLASDTDLTLKSGAGASVVRHERVGSWELNDKNVKGGSFDKDIESGRIERVVSGADYGRRSEEIVDPFGDPVKAAEHV